jgi:hypothetical protein
MKHAFTAAFQPIFNRVAHNVVTRFDRGRSPDRG